MIYSKYRSNFIHLSFGVLFLIAGFVFFLPKNYCNRIRVPTGPFAKQVFPCMYNCTLCLFRMYDSLFQPHNFGFYFFIKALSRLVDSTSIVSMNSPISLTQYSSHALHANELRDIDFPCPLNKS